MLPHEIFRAAADLIRAGGHSKGTDARDAEGNEVPLFTNTRGMTEVDTSRAEIGEASQLSIYGALATAMNRDATNPTRVWTVAAEEAARSLEGKEVAGGTNYLHPVKALNEHPDTDAAAAIAFLERCALLAEPTKAGG